MYVWSAEIYEHYIPPSLYALLFFFFKQKTAYEISLGLVGSEMCIRDSARLLGYLPALSNFHLHGK